ncbi:hypothetical protein [Paenarthrobacter sp. NPDC090522]|uniref:hypothetical protein n=1 Tax=Paenarthrobacter sp. NPDC090522 TaxID=3364383 RepID=UPI0037F3027E
MDNCGGLVDQESLKMCVYLADQVGQVKILPWITAAIGVFAAALTAFLSTYGSNYLQTRERRNTSQRQALHDVQNSALKLRKRLIAQAAGTSFSDDEQSAMIGKLKLFLSRVKGPEVPFAFEEWIKYAQLFYSGFEQYERYKEEDLWSTAVTASGAKLKKLD